jgi:hypothetical protein
MHAEWAIRAMQSGKHVLCEKPLALNLTEVTHMFDVARQNGVMLLESYPYWFQPQTRDLLACLSHDNIGQVISMQASFGFTLGNPEHNIRMKPDLGGGALLDAGSYPISLIRLVMGCAPERVMAHANWATTGVDINMMATLLYADGRSAQMSCAMNTANHRRATIVGTHGTVETEYLNHTSDSHTHPRGYLPSQLRLRKGIANSIAFEDIHSATGSGFRFAAEVFPTWYRKATWQRLSAQPMLAKTLQLRWMRFKTAHAQVKWSRFKPSLQSWCARPPRTNVPFVGPPKFQPLICRELNDQTPMQWRCLSI